MSTELAGIYFLEDCDFTTDNRLIPLPEDQSKFGLVLVFAHWCGNCKFIKPEFSKLLSMIPQDKVRLYALDGTGARGDTPSGPAEQMLTKRWPSIVEPMCKFRGFPSVYLFSPKGEVVAEFEGQRNAETLLQFVMSQI